MIDAIRDDEITFKTRTSANIGFILKEYCKRQCHTYNSYRYGDLDIQNLKLTLGQIGIVDNSIIIAY